MDLINVVAPLIHPIDGLLNALHRNRKRFNIAGRETPSRKCVSQLRIRNIRADICSSRAKQALDVRLSIHPSELSGNRTNGQSVVVVDLFFFACDGAIADVAAILNSIPFDRVSETISGLLRRMNGIS